MTTPEELRQDAARARAASAELRRLASRIDASHVHELPRLADDRTWVGPLATALADEIRRGIAELGWLAADLRARAAALDLRASDEERAAARVALLLAMP